MATRAIGRGTCNLSINVRKTVRLALGRAAFRLDVSTGEFCRRLFVWGSQFVVIVRSARTAVAADQRALDHLRAARAPESPGGVVITAEEAEVIERDIRTSLSEDQRIAACQFSVEAPR